MNTLIAILSDAYELVQSERKYFDGKTKLSRIWILKNFRYFWWTLSGNKKEDKHFLFISMPLNYEDDTNNEDEGMIEKVLNDARKNQKEILKKIEEN